MSPSKRHAKSLRARKCRQALAQIHPGDGITFEQRQSPLFSKLPPEIRVLIFEFALAGYRRRRRLLSDPLVAKRYIYCHPAYHYPLQFDTNLLLTCRLIYSEANHIPMKYARFEVVRMRASWPASEDSHPEPPFFTRFTSKNFAEMQEVEFFELSSDRASAYFKMPQFTPKIISFTTSELGGESHYRTYVGRLRRGFAAFDELRFPSSCKRLNLNFELHKCHEDSTRRAIADVGVQRLRTTDESIELSTEGNETMFKTFWAFSERPSSVWVDQNVPWAVHEYYDNFLNTIRASRKEFVVATIVLTARPAKLNKHPWETTAPESEEG